MIWNKKVNELVGGPMGLETIKLEDTVVVTEKGYEPLGDAGRGWNRAGRQV